MTFSYNPASQIASLTKTNDLFAWTGHGNGSTASVANGLNQLTSIGGTGTAHDSKGNLTTDPTTGKSFTYSSENLLKTSSGGTAATLGYDPVMRLYELAAGSTTRFAYDGVAMIAEYDGANALQRRFVHGPGVDEPLVHYEGTGTSNRSWLHADERGSVIALSDGTGAVTTINKYDEFGKPQATNVGRFQYTGQMWLGEIGAYYYKARIYAAHLGRFLQTDPAGYADSPNLYAYVLNSPTSLIDPLGWVVCTGSRINTDSCANSADPLSCSGDCGAFNGLSLQSANQRRWTNDLDSRLSACGQGNAAACLIPAQISGHDVGDAVEEVSNWFDYARMVGAAGEAQVRESFIESGVAVYGSQVYIKTPFGLRIMDFVVGSPAGTDIMAVEVKTNGGFYSYDQRMKDWSLNQYGGTISGGVLVPPLQVGTFIRIPTMVVRVWITK